MHAHFAAKPVMIKKLKESRGLFGLSLHAWENLMVFSLQVAALAAALGGVSTYCIVRLQREELRISQAQSEKLAADAARAEATAAKANEAAAHASARAAELAKETEELRKNNLDMRLKLSGRRITELQHKLLVDELSKVAAPFYLATMSDPESILFAKDILKTLTTANWTTGSPEMPLHEIWTGLVLFQSDDPALERLANALTKAGIEYLMGDDQHKRPKVTVMVGNKPPAF